MPQSSLNKQFQFRDVEAKWRAYWEDNDIFHASAQTEKKPYTVVIPPPNVTGILHMGHALNNTLQDIMVRYKRMRGFEVCWMPGTDHAGIATQNVVEKQLAREGKTRHDVGREELIHRLWTWKKKYGDTIINQLKCIGASCDWPRTRFTMDDDYSQAVRHVFIHLYKKGLIYRGQYIINWCPRCQTALSDEEVEHREQQGALYHIRYPVKDLKDGYVVVATTRPETMLGDTAVAVHPDDTRYADLQGRTLIVPLVNRDIPIVSDAFVDPAFGTGAVKVTPAHDPNDFEIGRRHNLDFISVMHPDGRMNDQAGEDFAGRDRFEAREAIIESLKNHKLLVNIEPHTHAVGHCYRCHTVVEPYLSQQWFVKMRPLAEAATRAVTEEKISFVPGRWTKVYLNWMENIRDWCISRQIWWGHRIPVWYDDQGQTYVANDEAEAAEQARRQHGRNVPLRQDEDVLDTWFSSWLWPFATFGWPDNNRDVEYFYPTQSLFTASEIIFFWVARMIMAGVEFMGDIPFSEINIHGTVRDTQGRKMSKSLGNAIDPLEIVEKYGADALRFSLIVNSGQDLYISREKFEGGRNFANKIWNAARLILMRVDSAQCRQTDDKLASLPIDPDDLASNWIISRLNATIVGVGEAIESFRFSEAENLIYDFFWKSFCDWYLEAVKTRFDERDIQRIVFAILERSVRIIHPFMPFVTEEIWQHCYHSEECLARQPWPAADTSAINPVAEAEMQQIIDIITAIRNCKLQWNVKPHQTVDAFFGAVEAEDRQRLQRAKPLLRNLAQIERFSVEPDVQDIPHAASGVVGKIVFAVPLGDVVDIEAEYKRLCEQRASLEQASAALSKRLQNPQFRQKAPQEVVAKEEQRLIDLKAQIIEMDKHLSSLTTQ